MFTVFMTVCFEWQYLRKNIDKLMLSFKLRVAMDTELDLRGTWAVVMLKIQERHYSGGLAPRGVIRANDIRVDLPSNGIVVEKCKLHVATYRCDQ
jgi:hypothetical protein